MKHEEYDVVVLGSGPWKLMRLIGWGKTAAPSPIRRIFDLDPSVLGGPSP